MKIRVKVLCFSIIIIVAVTIACIAFAVKNNGLLGKKSATVDLQSDAICDEGIDVEIVDIIKQFANAINERDINGYLSIFAPIIKEEMQQFLSEQSDTESFFVESKRVIVSIKRDDYKPIINDGVDYDEVLAYKVEEDDSVDSGSENTTLQNGINTWRYVVVKIAGKWYLYSVSTYPES